MIKKRGKIIKYFFILVFFILFLFTGKSANAQESDLIINEVMWCGTSSSYSDEWIELKNNSNNSIDLFDYKIYKSLNGVEKLLVEFESLILQPGQLIVILNKSSDDSQVLAENDESIYLYSSKISLSNTGLKLIVKDSDLNIIDISGDGSLPLAGNNDLKYSMERNCDIENGELSSSWHTATQSVGFKENDNQKGTPGYENSPQLFSKPENIISDNITKYINLNFSLEANVALEKVIDGDTIEIDLNGEKVRVRLLGIDTPESAYSSEFGIDEPFYTEAKQYMSNFSGKNIKILTSSNPNCQYDNYNRLLAMIVFEDNLLNIELIKQGFAKTYYLDNSLINQDAWLEIENEVRNNEVGIWKADDNSKVLINELMINPNGIDSENEWIELYNPNNFDVDISNWFIDDSDKGSSPYLIPNETIIKSKNFYIISSSQSNIALNNSTDSARLFSPNLKLIDVCSYSTQSVNEDISYARFDNSWEWTNVPTRGYENETKSEIEEYVQLDNIQDLENIAQDEFVKIKAIVNSSPGSLSKRYFYIQDNTAAAQVYLHSGDFPNIETGKVITVIGRKSGSESFRIIISDSEKDIVVHSERENVVPINLDINKISKQYIGKIIKVSGTVSRLSGQTFYIENNNNKLKVTIRDTLNIKRPNMSRGDLVEITGILYLSNYGNYSILPTSLQNINVIQLHSSEGNKIITVDKISALEKMRNDQAVIIEGVVNSIPGQLSSQYFYIQDDTGGVQIYSYNKIFSEISIGDYVLVKGIVSQDGKRIKIYKSSDIEILSKNNEVNIYLLEDHILSYYYGMLININGEVVSKNSDKILINTERGNYIFYIKSSQNFVLDININDKIKLTGIVEHISSEYRVVTRQLNDIITTPYLKNIALTSESDSNIYQKSLGVKTYKKFFDNKSNKAKFLENSPIKEYNYITKKHIIILLGLISQVLLILILWKKPKDNLLFQEINFPR